MATNIKIGRPTKYSSRILTCLRNYTKNSVKDGIFPTIEGFALQLGLGTRTLYDWENVHGNFPQTMDSLRDTQRQLLITKGLTGDYNTRFAMFLLKANHGMSQKEPLVRADQNNFMNISPETPAEALLLMNNEENEENN